MGLTRPVETDEYQDLREAIGLDRFSQVLLFSTEGNTDPMKFRKVLWDGEYPTDVKKDRGSIASPDLF